jgi:hypothetical protein
MSFRADYASGQRFVDKLTPRLERQLVNAYLDTLKSLRTNMAEYYAKYPMTYKEMAKFHRLEKLEADIRDILNKMGKTINKTTEAGLSRIYVNSNQSLAYALGNNYDIAFALPPQSMILEAINNPVSGIKVMESLDRNRGYIIQQINGEITRGLIRGDSFSVMARNLKKQMESNLNSNVLRIIRTEGHKVQTLGQLDGMAEAESIGVKGKKYWVATLDERTRHQHGLMDGREADEDGMFTLPDGTRTEGPGLSGDPAHDVNCRCTVEFRIDEAPLLRREKGTGVVKYKTYNEWYMKTYGEEP